jgi:hypothetical protein
MAGLLSDEELIDKLYGPDADTVDADVYRRFGLTPNLKRGTVLPIARDEQGNLTPAVPQSVIDFLKAVSLPGHVMRGGQYTPSDVTEMALNAGLLGSVATKPAVVLPSKLERNVINLPPAWEIPEQAKEMGFDTRAFHGTVNADAIDRAGRFDLPPYDHNYFVLYGERPSHYWFSTDPKRANSYADDKRVEYRATGRGVFPVNLRLGNSLVIDAGGKGYGWIPVKSLENSIEEREHKDKLNEMLDRLAKFRDPRPSNISTDNAAKFAKKLKYDSLVVKNVIDDKYGKMEPGTSIVVFDPRNIRSRFAAFDPAKKDSADLLAGIAGLPGVASFLEGMNKDFRKRGISKVTK